MNQPRQQQQPPGTVRAMSPCPDHGEQSYRGAGRLGILVLNLSGGRVAATGGKPIL